MQLGCRMERQRGVSQQCYCSASLSRLAPCDLPWAFLCQAQQRFRWMLLLKLNPTLSGCDTLWDEQKLLPQLGYGAQAFPAPTLVSWMQPWGLCLRYLRYRSVWDSQRLQVQVYNGNYAQLSVQPKHSVTFVVLLIANDEASLKRVVVFFLPIHFESIQLSVQF